MANALSFADITLGSSLFVDANSFVYHFIGEPAFGPACTDLLERVERGEIVGFTSAHILAEVSHRLMTIEACSTFGWPYQGIASRLRRHRIEVKRLNNFRQAIADIRGLGLTILPVSEDDVSRATDVSQQHGLLTNDSLLVALMQNHQLVNLASSDADFDAVSGVVRYAPT